MSDLPKDLISRKREKGPEQPDFGIWINAFKARLKVQYLEARNNQSAGLAQEFAMLLAAIYNAAKTNNPSIDAVLAYLTQKAPTITEPIRHILATNETVKNTIRDFLIDLAEYSSELDYITYNDILETTLIKMPFTFNASKEPQQ